MKLFEIFLFSFYRILHSLFKTNNNYCFLSFLVLYIDQIDIQMKHFTDKLWNHKQSENKLFARVARFCVQFKSEMTKNITGERRIVTYIFVYTQYIHIFVYIKMCNHTYITVFAKPQYE